MTTIYTHRPFCWLLLALSSGILIGHVLPFTLFQWLVVSLLLLPFSFFGRQYWLTYAAVFTLGAALIHVAHPPAMDVLHDWREILRQSFYQYLNSDEAGAMSAIVLGDRSQIPKEINMVFRHTGTGHILVIAGLHMAMMTAMVVFILKVIRIPRMWQSLLAVVCLLTYALLVGASIPVLRAALMASVLLGSISIEMESDTLNSLSFAALIILLMDARNLFDTSFQLSFAAVFGIIIFYAPIEKALSFCPRWLAGAVAVSTSAWMGITPFQFWHFGTITPIALMANLFIVPLLDLTVALGIGLALAGQWLPWAAWALAGCLKVVFNGMVILGFWFSMVPFGYFQIR